MNGYSIMAQRWAIHCRQWLTRLLTRNWRKNVQLLACLFPMLAYADGGFGPHLFKDTSASFWGDLLSIVGVGLLGLALFHLMATFFALLHVVLLALLLFGAFRGKYWRRGIVVCVLLLSAMYLCLAAILRESSHPESSTGVAAIHVFGSTLA